MCHRPYYNPLYTSKQSINKPNAKESLFNLTYFVFVLKYTRHTSGICYNQVPVIKYTPEKVAHSSSVQPRFFFSNFYFPN